MNRLQQRGVILVDVMAAIFILCVGLMPMAGLFTHVGRAGHSLKHQELAVFLAQERMEQVHGQGSTDWTAATLNGEAGAEILERSGVTFARNTQFRLRTDLDPAGHLMEAEVCVSWREKEQPYQTVLLTYFAVNTGIGNLQ